MRVAIIDLGTNSVRFDVHSLLRNGSTKLLHREKLMIRLGQGVFLKGKMDPAAIERAVQAFRHFRHVADSLGVKRVVAFGTSALREAQDSALFVETVSERTGIHVKVISGKEEAQLIALGVLSNEKLPKTKFALVDIGGGSTEISICRGKKVLFGDSYRLGTARLQQLFLKRSPPKPSSVEQLRGYIRNVLDQRMKVERWPGAEVIVGSSGTVRAIAKLIRKKSEAFSVRDLSFFVSMAQEMTTTQLLDFPGMEPKRVDMILSGAILLEEIALRLGAKKVIPSEFSLRDGIIEEQVQLAKSEKTSLLEFHLDDLIERATRFGQNRAHLERVMQMADWLFVRLKGVHGLDPSWKVYLLSTVILRDCGEVIGYSGKEKHSYYIVKNSDLPAMEPWEHEFIARLCLHYAGTKVSGKDLVPIGKDKKKRDAFLKLLALVRVIDALDLGPAATVKLTKASVSSRKIVLSYGGVGAAGMEQLLLDRKKQFFEDVFGRQLFLSCVKKG